MTHTTRIVLFGVVAALSCGPSAREPGAQLGPGGVDAPGTDPNGGGAPVVFPMGTIAGRVWAPNHGPGQTEVGHEIPISGALVYVSTDRPAPIPSGVYCEECVNTPEGGALTSFNGSFELSASPGDYWLVVQKGQFRLEQRITLGEGRRELLPAETTLPSKHDPDHGAWIPKIAVVKGSSDPIEDILAKLGFGKLKSDYRFESPTGEYGDELTLYTYDQGENSSAAKLLKNLDEMRQYHIIFFPCAPQMSSLDALLKDQGGALRNVRQYIKEGGKLYVTDWSGEVVDRAFPQQIELGDAGTDTKGSYDPISLSGTFDGTPGNANGGSYSNDDGQIVDTNLASWLGNQVGPTAASSIPGVYDPARLTINGNYNWIRKVNAVLLGNDDQGNPVYDDPKVWLIGGKPGTQGLHPQAVTYQPTGCGKVLFSTFQTANPGAGHKGLFPQERVLLYLIMEIQQCVHVPVIE